jgi:hypothetical protein
VAPYDPKTFLEQLAPHILAELKPPEDLKKFTRNSDVVGHYVEASVRQLVRRYLAPIRVCTGAVIDQAQSPGSEKIPQLDTIAWIPGPVSAVFEVGEFGLVPRSSCLGILEVKSSAYSSAIVDLRKRTKPYFVRSVTADLEGDGREGELLGYVRDGGSFGMGVVSLLQKKQQGSKKLKALREGGQVVVLFEERGSSYVPQREDIYRLVNFLGILRFRAAARDGRVGIIRSCSGMRLLRCLSRRRRSPGGKPRRGGLRPGDGGGANKIKGQKLRGVSVLHGHLGGQKQQVPPLRRR